MKQTIALLIILACVSLLFEFLLAHLKKKTSKQLMRLLIERNWDEFDRLINTKSTKFFIPVYNSMMLQISKAQMLNDSSLLNSLMQKLSKVKMNDHEKLFAYSKAFSYYTIAGDKKRATICYKKVMECKDESSKEYVKMVYNTLIEKKWDYLEEATKLYENTTGEDSENLRVLINAMYQNKGDITKV